MTIHVPVQIGSNKIHNTAAGTDQHFDIVTCPECAMTAALQQGDRIESTDGPVEHVRIICVNRHWFLMPADTLTGHRRTPEGS